MSIKSVVRSKASPQQTRAITKHTFHIAFRQNTRIEARNAIKPILIFFLYALPISVLFFCQLNARFCHELLTDAAFSQGIDRETFVFIN